MNPEPDEFRDFPEPFIDVAHPFSSPTHAQIVNDLPEVSDSSNITFENAKLMESDKVLTKTKIIENDNEVEEHSFIEEFLTNRKLFDINQFDLIIKNLNKKFKYLQIECEKVQQITIHFEK
jgi:hypothetical protein